MFQPAEEGVGGARAMLADGLFERFPMERIFGYHNWPGLAAGTVAVHDGPVMAAGSRVEIRLDGHAGHAAMPHLTRDPMLAAAHLLVALQSVVSRNVDPLDSAVLSIVHDAEPARRRTRSRARSTMRGTYRTHRPAVDALVDAAIRRIADGIARGVRDGGRGRDPRTAPPARRTARRRRSSPPQAAEAAGLRAAPRPAAEHGRRGFRLVSAGEAGRVRLDRQRAGRARNGELHNPGYDFNDAILPAAAGWMAAVAKRALREGG